MFVPAMIMFSILCPIIGAFLLWGIYRLGNAHFDLDPNSPQRIARKQKEKGRNL